jgi:hypothetical protein
MSNGEQLKLQFQKSIGLIEHLLHHVFFHCLSLLFECCLALQFLPESGFVGQEPLLSESEELFRFVRKVNIERAPASSRFRRNVFNAGRFKTISNEDIHGSFEQSLAGGRRTKVLPRLDAGD